LFGGFEDIGSQDSEEESEDDLSDPDVPRTKEGYVKDGFIVDDDDEEDDDEEEEEYVEPKPKRKARVSSSKKDPKEKREKKKKPETSDLARHKNEIVSNTNDTPESSYLECTSELSEEAYFE
jgi:transcription elongation factor SPT6